jgi:stage V sporulation protein T
MKATGIVRRIDDLGRVVVPKEIRKTLHIREGDPLEIFTDREGEIILKKYSPIGELGSFARQYAEALAHSTGHVVSITDRDNHIAVAGNGKRELMNKPVSKALDEAIEKRKMVTAAGSERDYIPLTESESEHYSYQVICPIISEGDAIGAVVIVSKDEKSPMGDVEKKLAAAAAGFLGRQIEQ